MENVVLVMRDGRGFCGPVWDFQPRLGWIAIVDERAPERIFLRDVQAGSLNSERAVRGVTRVEDVLAKAKELGWNGL